MEVESAYRILYSIALIILAVSLGVLLARSIRGPGVTDRLLCINMIGTLVIAAIVILSKLLGETWLLDVALIYTMISMVSVLILARVLIPPKTPEISQSQSQEAGQELTEPEENQNVDRRAVINYRLDFFRRRGNRQL